MAPKSLYDYDKTEPGTATSERGAWREGFCTICATDKAPHTCVKCDSHVCSEHFVSIMGLCVECAPVKDRGKSFKIAEPLKKEIPRNEIPGPTKETPGPREKKSNPAKKTYEIVAEPVKKRKMKKIAFIPKGEDDKEDPCPCAKSHKDGGKSNSSTEETEDEPTIDWV